MDEGGPPKNGDVLPPEGEPNAESAPEELNVLALISNYTDRPDLLIAEVEKHDPGFVKRMNQSAREHSEQYRGERLTFGKRQAYTALAVTVIAAVVILGVLVLAVLNGQGFWTILGLAVFYAVTQGGQVGFTRIVDACADAVRRLRGERPDSD